MGADRTPSTPEAAGQAVPEMPQALGRSSRNSRRNARRCRRRSKNGQAWRRASAASMSEMILLIRAQEAQAEAAEVRARRAPVVGPQQPPHMRNSRRSQRSFSRPPRRSKNEQAWRRRSAAFDQDLPNDGAQPAPRGSSGKRGRAELQRPEDRHGGAPCGRCRQRRPAGMQVYVVFSCFLSTAREAQDKMVRFTLCPPRRYICTASARRQSEARRGLAPERQTTSPLSQICAWPP